VLFVVPYAPTRIRTRPFHLVRALASGGHQVTVATLWKDDDERAAVDSLTAEGIEVVAGRLPTARSAWNCLRALPGADPLQAHFSWSPSLAQRLRRMVCERVFDAVHVEHLRGVRYGLAVAGAIPRDTRRRPTLVWDSVDCITSLFRRAAREGHARRVRLAARLELPRTERYEGVVSGQFDRVLVTSDTDRRELVELAERHAGSGEVKVEVLPNGVDLDYFSPSPQPREPRTLVMTGKMSYHANATAAIRFVQDVMPAVWSHMPDVRLYIVGKDPTREVTKLGESPWGIRSNGHSEGSPGPRVLVTGTVDDVRPYLRRAAVAVAPIRYGVGIQNKVLEALACGAPVVATSQAASALEIRSGAELMIASDPSEFARMVVALLDRPDERARLASAGRAYVERRHGWPALGTRLAGVYRDTRAGAKDRRPAESRGSDWHDCRRTSVQRET